MGDGILFAEVIDHFQPLLLELAHFLGDRAHDVVKLGRLSSSFFKVHHDSAIPWKEMLLWRWPAFHDAFVYRHECTWRDAYRLVLTGQAEVTMEVFDRRKEPGFAMSAMSARVCYSRAMSGFRANYISATAVQPELIPEAERFRLRYCPASAHKALKLGEMQEESCCFGNTVGKEPLLYYPFKVLDGVSGLVVGEGVELQWKMQVGSPFGWWYGTLECLVVDADGRTASATIVFKHFPSSSPWYRLKVRFGDSEIRECLFGGYTGGLRGVSADEQKQWMRFWPKNFANALY